jgi:hypothetical protein
MGKDAVRRNNPGVGDSDVAFKLGIKSEIVVTERSPETRDLLSTAQPMRVKSPVAREVAGSKDVGPAPRSGPGQ